MFFSLTLPVLIIDNAVLLEPLIFLSLNRVNFQVCGCRLYNSIGPEKLFSPRCRMLWDKYFRRYWLVTLSAYQICCTDLGTISLLYLCMNVFVLLFNFFINKINISTVLHFISVLPSWFSDWSDICMIYWQYLCFFKPPLPKYKLTKSLPVTNT
jgi:hypothetical protein